MGIGVGIFLTAIGAVLAFALNVDTNGSGVNVHTIGIILLIVGILGILLSMFFWSSWGGFGGGRRGGSSTTVAPPGSTTTTIE